MSKFISSEYTKDFYEKLSNAQNDSRIIIEQLLEVFREADYKLNSVVDLGCGIGQWLDSFTKVVGKEVEIQGYDGDRVGDQIIIPKENFAVADLSKPLNTNRKYDLAMSLEVAEHINESSADIFVESLINLSDVVMFSAAIPYQKGTHHVNCQWQTYWIDKFEKRGYQVLDCIRPKVWNQGVAYYYAQNILLYYRKDSEKTKGFERLKTLNVPTQYNVVHPSLWEDYMSRFENLTAMQHIKIGVKSILK